MAHRADETGRPASGEKLFRIGARPCRCPEAKADVELCIVAARETVASAGRMGLAGVEDFLDFGHGTLLCFVATCDSH